MSFDTVIKKEFEMKDYCGDILTVQYDDEKELALEIKNINDESDYLIIVLEDNDKDREKAKNIIEVLQAYVNQE